MWSLFFTLLFPPVHAALPPLTDLTRFPSLDACDAEIRFLIDERYVIRFPHGLGASPPGLLDRRSEGER
jgi:hypothetical protein